MSGSAQITTREGDEAVSVSVLIVTYRRRRLLDECLMSLERALARIPEKTEVIVVDNGSQDETRLWMNNRLPSAHVIEIAENVGFTRALMIGIRRTRGRWIALLNDDTTVEEGALKALVDAGESLGTVGSVAAQMRFADRPQLINSAGLEIDKLGIAADRLAGRPAAESEQLPIEVFGTSGGGALYRRGMLDELGGFDESFFGYMEDADLAWRAQMRGWRCLYEPRAIVYHHHSATLTHGSRHKYFLVGRNRVRLLAKNATTRQLLRYGLTMLAYDYAYILHVALRERTLAPVAGRLQGLREWPTYRQKGSALRRDIDLAPIFGIRAALHRNRTWKTTKSSVRSAKTSRSRRA